MQHSDDEEHDPENVEEQPPLEDAELEEPPLVSEPNELEKPKRKPSKGRARSREKVSSSKEIDPREKGSTCSSCGGEDYWAGDGDCPTVISGKDKPVRSDIPHFRPGTNLLDFSHILKMWTPN